MTDRPPTQEQDVLERLKLDRAYLNAQGRHVPLCVECHCWLCDSIAEIERLRSGLSFYADAQNYVRKDHYSTPNQDFPAWTEPSKVMNDCGSKAREMLYGK